MWSATLSSLRRHWKKAIGCGCLGLLAAAAASVAVVIFLRSDAAEDFQRDADIIRLRHLHYYGSLLEEYRAATGRYPLQGREPVPVYVLVGHSDQLRQIPPGPEYEHVVVPFAELVEELQAGLGRSIEERYDPQLFARYKPNFYIYKVTSAGFFFAVHTHQGFPFATRVGDNYFKVEISSIPTELSGALDPSQLLESVEFKAETGRSVEGAAFFTARERKYLRHSRRRSE
ncbi:MAG: hypothetical protein GY854_24935 [Deltaproteobacteria bacterium]|nr:hypothetical protein [Deltaproteobacteria bacterium]